MAGVSVTIVNGRRAEVNLRRLSTNTFSFVPAFNDIGDYFRSQVKMQFEARGSFPGVRGPWAKLSPVTIALRGGSSRQLVRFHNLMNSYTNTFAPGNISSISAHSAQFGSEYRAKSNKGKIVPTALWHQTGTSKMPDRPVVLGNRLLDENILDSVVDQLFSGWVTNAYCR